MKTLTRFIVVSSALLLPLAAQDRPQVGFVRVVHALAPGEGTMQLLIDGENMFPKGYKLGQRTGGIGLAAGSRTIEVRKEGVEPGATKLPLESGETVTLVAFGVPIPADEVKEGGPKWTAKILKLKQQDVERGYRLTVVSVSGKPELAVKVAVEGKGKVEGLTVKRLATGTLDLGGVRGGVELRLGEEPLAFVSLDDPGNYVVVLYDDGEGKVCGLSFFDPRFVIAG